MIGLKSLVTLCGLCALAVLPATSFALSAESARNSIPSVSLGPLASPEALAPPQFLAPLGVEQQGLWQQVEVSPAAPVDLTWRARASEAGGAFRLYRVEAGGEPAMMAEVAAVPGEEVYRFRDGRCAQRHCDYALIYVDPEGEEISLGTVRRESVSSHSDPALASSQSGLSAWLRAADDAVFLAQAFEPLPAARRFDHPRPRPATPPPDAARS